MSLAIAIASDRSRQRKFLRPPCGASISSDRPTWITMDLKRRRSRSVAHDSAKRESLDTGSTSTHMTPGSTVPCTIRIECWRHSCATAPESALSAAASSSHGPEPSSVKTAAMQAVGSKGTGLPSSRQFPAVPTWPARPPGTGILFGLSPSSTSLDTKYEVPPPAGELRPSHTTIGRRSAS